MAWYSGLFGDISGLSDQDQQKIANQGLLRAGLGILAANGRPGTTPFQAISSGVLGGLDSVQQSAENLQNSRYKQAIMQSTMADMQRKQKLQALAQQFAKPDGTFDMQGYQQALNSIDPAAAVELHQNQLRGQLYEAQARDATAKANAKMTREIESGSNKITQEFDPSTGKWNDIATSPKWNPRQMGEIGGGGHGALGPGAFQIIQGQDGQYYNVNKVTGEPIPLAIGGQGVIGANALRNQSQELKNADATSAAQGGVASFDVALKSLNGLKTDPGLSSGTGLTGAVARNVPGTDAYTFARNLDAFKAQTFLPQVQNLRGMGALSDAEGKKLSDSIGALDPGMSKQAFLKSIDDIQQTLTQARQRAMQKASRVQQVTGGFNQGAAQVQQQAQPVADPLGILK